MPAKRILFGFLLCLALWLVVLAAQALTLGTEKSLFPYRTEQVACVEFQSGTTGARHLLFLINAGGKPSSSSSSSSYDSKV